MDNFFNITIGNVITWGVALITLGIAWQKLQGMQEANADRQKSNGVKIDQLARDVKHLDEQGGTATRGRHEALLRRVDALEVIANQDAEQRSKIAVIANDINWIKSVLKSVLRHTKHEFPDEHES